MRLICLEVCTFLVKIKQISNLKKKIIHAMKFMPKSIPKINLDIFRSGKVWIYCSVLFFILSIVLWAVKFGISSGSAIDEGLENATRLEFSLENGEVKGLLLSLKKAEKPKPEDIKDVPSESNIAEHGNDADEQEEAKKSSKQPSLAQVDDADDSAEEVPLEQKNKQELPAELSWMNEDYIGPPMSQNRLDIISGFNSKKDLEVKKVSVSELSDKPVVVIVIKGLGLSSSTTEHALELPKNITLGFSPYSPSIQEWAKKARDKGHEIVLNIPMETKDYNLNDPGPYAVITSASKEDNNTRLKMLLSLIDGYEAVYSETEEVFTKSVQSIKPFLEFLKGQGKYYIYGGGYAEFSLIQVAESIKYPILVNDIILDDVISEQGINEQFREIERRARERGYVVVMAHPYPITIRMLERWLPQVESRGIDVAPISLLLGKQFVD